MLPKHIVLGCHKKWLFSKRNKNCWNGNHIKFHILGKKGEKLKKKREGNRWVQIEDGSVAQCNTSGKEHAKQINYLVWHRDQRKDISNKKPANAKYVTAEGLNNLTTCSFIYVALNDPRSILDYSLPWTDNVVPKISRSYIYTMLFIFGLSFASLN